MNPGVEVEGDLDDRLSEEVLGDLDDSHCYVVQAGAWVPYLVPYQVPFLDPSPDPYRVRQVPSLARLVSYLVPPCPSQGHLVPYLVLLVPCLVLLEGHAHADCLLGMEV